VAWTLREARCGGGRESETAAEGRERLERVWVDATTSLRQPHRDKISKGPRVRLHDDAGGKPTHPALRPVHMPSLLVFSSSYLILPAPPPPSHLGTSQSSYRECRPAAPACPPHDRLEPLASAGCAPERLPMLSYAASQPDKGA